MKYIMTDKLREMERYLKLQIKETERLMFASKGRHDTVDADKWMAVSDAYEDCYTRLFGNYERENDK